MATLNDTAVALSEVHLGYVEVHLGFVDEETHTATHTVHLIPLDLAQALAADLLAAADEFAAEAQEEADAMARVVEAAEAALPKPKRGA